MKDKEANFLLGKAARAVFDLACDRNIPNDLSRYRSNPVHLNMVLQDEALLVLFSACLYIITTFDDSITKYYQGTFYQYD